MNDEFNPGAPPSGLFERKNKQDDRPGSATPGDLHDFLIRRQLLAMEGKRIQAILREAEIELNAKQDNLTDIRERVLASLRNHLANLGGLAQAESLSRQRLENLPRLAERYLRPKGKRLFARLRSRASTGKTDKRVRAQDPVWYLPKIQQLDGWAAWFAEIAFEPKGSRFRKDRIQVALAAGGGLGDLLKSTHLAGSVSDRFSGDLTIIAAQRAVREVIAHNPYVHNTITPANRDVFGFAEGVGHIPVFDLIIVWRYDIQYVIAPGSRITRQDIRALEEKSAELRRKLEKYSLSQGRPAFFRSFSRETTRMGLSAIKVSIATSGLHYRHPDTLPFFPGRESARTIAQLLTKRYVTVHHGFDTEFLPVRTRETTYRSTKNLSMQQWRQIASLIRDQGIDVIQLGVVDEEKIEGVTHCLNGQTSFDETGLLIKHSLCHIDTEGGLVHLANAVHTRCVVLFGPTPVEFFGYPQNINLQPSGCKACWFATQNWLIECPRHTEGPECMSGHSASSVVQAVKTIIAESENLSAKLIAAEPRPSQTPMVETVAATQRLLSRDAAKRVLLILDDLPGDLGSELSDRVSDRTEVIVCQGERPGLEPNDRGADRLEYGSILNLPRASSSVDAVIWVWRELEPDIAPFALREIFRILKPGGELVCAPMSETSGLDLRRSLLAGRISFDQDEAPSGATYSCSLRKGVPTRPSTAVSFGSSAAQPHSSAVDSQLLLLEDENRRQITLVRDRFAQQEKVTDEARAVVDGAVRRAFGADGWIWVSNLFAEGYPAKFFLRGWRAALDWVIWSRENKCLLMLPFDEGQEARGHGLELQLHLALPQASASSPAAIGVRINDGPVENFVLSTDDEILTIRSSTDGSKFRGVALVEFELGASIIAGGSDELWQPVALGVKRFRYRILNSQEERLQPAL